MATIELLFERTQYNAFKLTQAKGRVNAYEKQQTINVRN
jgi:hypothetical protein